MSKKLLVAVDLQKDFIDGALGTPQAQQILPAVRERIARARTEGESIVFTRDTHGQDYSETQEGRNLPVAHCLRGSEGWLIVPGLYAGERVFDKPAFGSVELAEYVRDEGFDEVELIGVCTDICVISNALLIKAFCPEAELSVRADCCAGVSPESHERTLLAMQVCQIKVI